MAVLALPELQQSFTAGLLGGENTALLDLIEGDGLDARARLGIYRHHVLTTLTAVLDAVYPVACALVDRRFFGYAADAFIRRHPPAGPCLGEYGADFPEFLAEFPPCAHLPYLPDVARLEWAVHLAATTPPAAALDREGLRAVDPGRMADVTFTLEPSLSHLTSPWPVEKIWRAHQAEGKDLDVDMTGGSVWLEVRATGDAVTVRSIESGTYALRDALGRGMSLGEAVEIALGSHPTLDVEAEIRSTLEDNIFSHFTVLAREET